MRLISSTITIKPSIPNILLTMLAMSLVACSDSGKVSEPSLSNDTTSSLDTSLEHAALLDNIPTTLRTELHVGDATADGTNSVLSVELAQRPETSAFKVSLSDDVEDQNVVFNDLGIAGDAVESDGVYSTVVNSEDTTDDLIEVLESQSGKAIPLYKGLAQSGFVQHFKIAAGKYGANGPITGDPSNIDVFRELMITDPLVVEDPVRTYDPCAKQGTPNGEWTFARLFRNIANQERTGITPEALAQVWVDQILNPVSINAGETRPTDLERAVLQNWIAQSGGEDQSLDLDKAPFRLLAIVNRIDLRTRRNAGEVRFVFGALRTDRCEFEESAGPAPYSVIFEYRKTGSSHRLRKKWGRQWHELADFELGSSDYNRNLEILTRKVTQANINREQRPNRTALSLLRTNAELDEGRIWLMREFKMAENSNSLLRGFIEHSTLNKTPSEAFNKTDALSEYMNNNARKIAKNKHSIPLISAENGEPMATGSVFVGLAFTGQENFWEGSTTIPVDPETRHLFSLNTCNGCHGRETNTEFVHINPERQVGFAARLSRFMTGGEVGDPTDPSILRSFNELERRAQDLDALVNLPRAVQAFREPPSELTKIREAVQ